MKPLLALAFLLAPLAVNAEPIGDVDTAFKLIGPDHKVVVEAYDDPKVGGVTCYVSRAQPGCINGALGVAAAKAATSLAPRSTCPPSLPSPVPPP